MRLHHFLFWKRQGGGGCWIFWRLVWRHEPFLTKKSCLVFLFSRNSGPSRLLPGACAWSVRQPACFVQQSCHRRIWRDGRSCPTAARTDSAGKERCFLPFVRHRRRTACSGRKKNIAIDHAKDGACRILRRLVRRWRGRSRHGAVDLRLCRSLTD